MIICNLYTWNKRVLKREDAKQINLLGIYYEKVINIS